MITETGLKCVVSGSFSKFKPKIDETIREFLDLGVKVLAPDTGNFLKPAHHILTLNHSTFRPLETEAGMSVSEIENRFLEAIKGSNFQYIENPDGYVGDVVSLEIGFAFACGILVFSRQPISTLLDPDPAWKKSLTGIEVLTPQSVVKRMLELAKP